MAQFELWFRQDLKDAVHVQRIPGDAFQADANSTLIGVELTDDGETASLSGYGVAGYCIREDGTTLVQAGTISGNKASIVVPSNALTMVGKLDIVIKLTKNSDRITVLAVSGHVYRTTTDVIDVPEHLVPSLDELLEEIQEAESGMSNSLKMMGNAPAGSLADVIDFGYYGLPSSATYSDLPISDAYGMIVTKPSSNGGTIFQVTFGTNNICYRLITFSGSERTVRAWKRIPINSIDCFGGCQMFTVQRSASSTFTISNNSRIRIDAFGGRDTLLGSILISCTSAGVITKYQTGASDLTVTAGTNSITIANGSANAAAPLFCTTYVGSMSENTP